MLARRHSGGDRSVRAACLELALLDQHGSELGQDLPGRFTLELQIVGNIASRVDSLEDEDDRHKLDSHDR